MIESKHVFEHIDELTYEIGPRLAGSKRSRKASEYIRENFENFGLNPSFQDFDFVDVVLKNRIMGVILMGIFLVAPFIASLYSLIVVLAGYIVVYSLPWILPKKTDRNVVARLEPEGQVDKRIIIGAHYDSARCVKSFDWVYFFKIGLPILLAAFLALSIFRFFIGDFPWLIGWGCLLIPYALVSISPFWLYENLVSPGANDNASGTSVMLEVARVASESDLENTELRFVAFGGEEQGLAGSKKFSEENLKADLFLNLDSLGSGENLAVVEGNGVLFKKFTDPKLNKQIEDRLNAESYWAPVSYHDHVPFVEKGVRSTTLTSVDLNEKGRLEEFLEKLFKLSKVSTRPHSDIHTREDVPDNIKMSNIERSGNLILELVGLDVKDSG